MIINKEMNDILNKLKYNSGPNTVFENEYYLLTKPFNTWDMNYRLNELETDITYLIDVDDMEDVEYYDIDFYIESLKELAWKIEQ